MSIDLPRVPDATQSRLASDEARLPRVSRGERGGKDAVEHKAIARLASPSSTVRFRFPGADAVLSISIESNEADSMGDSQSVIDLTDSELGNDQLAAIISWLGGRLGAHPGAPQRLAPGGLTKWRLRRVLTYIEQHICEPIKLATLAEVAGLSKMYFAAQFRAATGCRPHECILRTRIEHAQQMLLDTAEPLVSIALAVGFQSHAHFSTVFKRFVGLSPYQWRAANRDLLRGVQHTHPDARSYERDKDLDGVDEDLRRRLNGFVAY
jgi:AraC family transcriptional regulator